MVLGSVDLGSMDLIVTFIAITTHKLKKSLLCSNRTAIKIICSWLFRFLVPTLITLKKLSSLRYNSMVHDSTWYNSALS